MIDNHEKKSNKEKEFIVVNPHLLPLATMVNVVDVWAKVVNPQVAGR